MLSCSNTRMSARECGHKVLKNRNNVEWTWERKINYRKYYRKLMKQVHDRGKQ